MAFWDWLVGVTFWTMLTAGVGMAALAFANGDVGGFIALGLIAYVGYRGVERRME